MKNFRINYIDGHDLRYKSIEIPAISKDDALSKLRDMYDADYDHQIIEVIKDDSASAVYMRIGGSTLASPPFTQESILYLEAHHA